MGFLNKLKEVASDGVNNIITFDAHDPRINNSIPLNGFDNFLPPYQFIRALLDKNKDLLIDKDHLMVISPDEGAMHRAVYFANVLGVDMGMFCSRKKGPAIRGMIYSLCIFATEFCSGAFLKKRGCCPWDYSKARFNIKGIVRLDYLPVWFVVGLIYEKILCPDVKCLKHSGKG